MNNAAVDMSVQVLFLDPIFNYLGIYPGVEILDHMIIIYDIIYIYINIIMFSIVVVVLYILTNRTQGFQFLYILANTCNFLLFEK